MSEIKYKIAAGTNVGLIRKNNEDNFVVCPDLTSSDWRIPQVSDYADLGEFGALLVVADGMGGANAGEVASAIAVETIQQFFIPEHLKDVIADDKAIQEFMKEVVKAADLNIFNSSCHDSSTQGMGTTIVIAWILNDKVYLCWCGDSRCYLLNEQKGLIRLSKDHSYVQDLIDKGELEPELAMDHPLSNIITRCLGDMQSRAIPDTRISNLHDGDIILLCSDGLSGMCNDTQILDILIKYHDNLEECKNELISAALNEGGHDNVTVALCNVQMKKEVESHAGNESESTFVPSSHKEDELSETATHVPIHHSNGMKWIWFVLLTIIVVIITFFVMKKAENPKADAMIFPTESAAVNDSVVISGIEKESPSPMEEQTVDIKSNESSAVYELSSKNVQQEADTIPHDTVIIN